MRFTKRLVVLSILIGAVLCGWAAFRTETPARELANQSGNQGSGDQEHPTFERLASVNEPIPTHFFREPVAEGMPREYGRVSVGIRMVPATTSRAVEAELQEWETGREPAKIDVRDPLTQIELDIE